MDAHPFDLARYLDRVGLSATPRIDLDGLVAVHAAQLRAVPFENFDVLLHGRVNVEPRAVFDKLVVRRRGGYCFECNGLLHHALRTLGFEARMRLARVVIDRGDSPVPPRTHAIVEVRLGGAHHVVDCGFGAQTPRAPVRLADDAGIDDDAGDGGWQLRADPTFGWRMRRTTPGAPPRDLYVLDRTPVYPADVALGNHWTSTHPSSHFTQRPLAVRHTDHGRLVLNGRRLIEHAGETHEEIIDDVGAWLRAIRERLGLPLEVDPEQRDRLWATSAVAPRGDRRG